MENEKLNEFISELLSWAKQTKLTLDDTQLVKRHTAGMLQDRYPNYKKPFRFDIQYYVGGEYCVIPRDLATGLAICGELPKDLSRIEEDRLFDGVFYGDFGTYEYSCNNFIFRPYLKPVKVTVDMNIRESS